ncbi:MAG: hypothetical protein WCF77_04285 [Minisyncoccia bacterium]
MGFENFSANGSSSAEQSAQAGVNKGSSVEDHGHETVSSKPKIADELAKDPKFAEELELIDDPRIFENPEAVDGLIYHYELRKESVARSNADLGNRFMANPYASEEELRAGVYKEALEPQVREAVFALRNKGYDTFESGFHDLVVGDQYVGFRKDSNDSIKIDTEALNERFKGKGIGTKFYEEDDRYTLSLISSADLSLEEWGRIWAEVADAVPAREGKSIPLLTGAETFVEQQRKLKAGEDVYLGGNYFFRGGKVVKEE